MLDQAIESLKTYDWGTDLDALQPIEDAVIATHGDAAARADLEAKLTGVLQSGLSRDGIDYVCRKLRVIGTAASVPALKGLLAQQENSHMARYALEDIKAPEAAAALQESLAELTGDLKVGVISTLGVRRDPSSVAYLAGLVNDDDAAVACAAVYALGDIRSADAAAALSTAKPRQAVDAALTDASLACAEGLVGAGKKAKALAIYKKMASGDQPKHVRLAAAKGMLTCAGQ
ncbi:hypothetical protein Pla175_26610 [Pirellulimonas nuda]|uniref:PBS lyase HEAT-like repeat protein n=1 Tax=Pirellulimonas nuda TaxID=2528009 RepID=A0A518DCU3_9BACT|nr:HEAT repeat domain-containing protein [Pirellulimonas nuda]QDU89273.1 hypothetical protein Pla175_26610 [Pirellulimonas nuda]